MRKFVHDPETDRPAGKVEVGDVILVGYMVGSSKLYPNTIQKCLIVNKDEHGNVVACMSDKFVKFNPLDLAEVIDD